MNAWIRSGNKVGLIWLVVEQEAQVVVGEGDPMFIDFWREFRLR